jgi:hypothetical protein
MSIPPSSAAKLPLPRWAYVFGETDEAGADYETLAQAKLLVPARFQDFVPARHPALRYGITLNDSGYFWEAQEVLEAVWAAAPQGGRERTLLRACIQIANANLRLRMGKPHAAARLLGERWESSTCLMAARRSPAATDLSTVFRGLRLWRGCRPNWGSRRCPKLIGSKSAPAAGYEAK